MPYARCSASILTDPLSRGKARLHRGQHSTVETCDDEIPDDVSGDRVYILDSYDTRAEAEGVAKKCCSGLPYSFEIEEEPVVDYTKLIA